MTARCIGPSARSVAVALTYLPALRNLGRGPTRGPGACEPRSGSQQSRSALAQFTKLVRAVRSSSASPARQSHRSEVERLITSLLPSGEARIDSVARRLGCSRQTLYRRLKAEEVTFDKLLDGVRRRTSLQLVREGVPIKEIAYRVGFSEPSAFSRAFKRWTGTTPGKF
jgi:AraC-like DNA-binding protein